MTQFTKGNTYAKGKGRPKKNDALKQLQQMAESAKLLPGSFLKAVQMKDAAVLSLFDITTREITPMLQVVAAGFQMLQENKEDARDIKD
jgi:hypothetical protein